jgi:hypothetical protein
MESHSLALGEQMKIILRGVPFKKRKGIVREMMDVYKLLK